MINPRHTARPGDRLRIHESCLTIDQSGRRRKIFAIGRNDIAITTTRPAARLTSIAR
jgi:hypothetical protein